MYPVLMTILLSHESARSYWAHEGLSGRRAPTLGNAALQSAAGNKADVGACGIDLLNQFGKRPEWLGRPVDLLLPSRQRRGSVAGVRYHVCSLEIPPGSLARVARDVCVTSPELTFVQLGRMESVPVITQYAMELCGGYALAPWSQTGFVPRAPLCSPEGLGWFVDACTGMPGVHKAAEALWLMGERSMSPAETRLFLLLTLPRRLFGYGLPRPLLNQRIEIPPDAQLRLGCDYLIVDFLFREHRLVVEYDSRTFHGTVARLDHDDDRREVLQDMGYDVVVVRAERLENHRRFDALVRQTIARRLGIEVPPMDARFVRGVQNLRDDLR